MNIPAASPIHLLHRQQVGTLATHARDPAGFPYPTVVPYATDARHRPIVLVSALAEHTRNLAADPRAGFLVVDTASGEPLDAERVTLVGRFVRIDDDPYSVARYRRFYPDAARYLALGDFSFWVLECEQLRFIGGFGRMGWLDGRELGALAPLSFDDERGLWDVYPGGTASPELLGVDRYGADWRIAGRLRRTPFPKPVVDSRLLTEAVRQAAATCQRP